MIHPPRSLVSLIWHSGNRSLSSFLVAAIRSDTRRWIGKSIRIVTISLELVSSLWPQSKFIRPGDFKNRPGRRIEASVRGAPEEMNPPSECQVYKSNNKEYHNNTATSTSSLDLRQCSARPWESTLPTQGKSRYRKQKKAAEDIARGSSGDWYLSSGGAICVERNLWFMTIWGKTT